MSSVQSTYLLPRTPKKMSKLSSVCGEELLVLLVAYSAATCRFLGRLEFSTSDFCAGFSLLRGQTEGNFHSLRQSSAAKNCHKGAQQPKIYLLTSGIRSTYRENNPRVLKMICVWLWKHVVLSRALLGTSDGRKLAANQVLWFTPLRGAT